jgi:8-oxo-dGTP pyrophosphatase MutT (NUDIX family)
MNQNIYKDKYLKYKNKYLNLKEQKGGGMTGAFFFIITDVPKKNNKPIRSVLLTLERRKNNGLEYSLPGGTIDFGYDSWNTAKKELLEETGMAKIPQLTYYPKLSKNSDSLFVPKINKDIGGQYERCVYMTYCNYDDLYYNPSNVSNNETVGMILFPCEELLNIINNKNNDNIINLKIRHDIKDCLIKIFNNNYLDSSYNIIKSDY